MNDFAMANATLPPLVRAALSGALFSWLVVALGRRALCVLQLPMQTVSRAERAFLAGAIGAGFLQYLPFGLAMFGMLRPAPVRVAMLILSVLLSIDLYLVAIAALSAVRSLKLRLDFSDLLWTALLATLLLVLIVRASTVGDFSDDDGYHLASPKRWLAQGWLAYLPSYTNTNASMGFELLYAIGLSVWDVVAAKAFHFAAGVFCLLGVWLSAKRIAGARAGALALSVLLITNPLVCLPYVFALAYVDLGACWMAMACLFCWLVWRERQETKWLACMALCAGFTGSFKTTAIVTGIVWLPAILFEMRRKGVGWSRSVVLLTAFGAVSLIPVLPWFARSALLTGNPIYPMFSSIIPTRDWPAEHASNFARYTRYHAWGINSNFSDTTRKLILLAFGGVFAAVGTFSALRMRRLELKGLAIFSTLFTVCSLAMTGLIYRYWLPAAMGASVIIGVVVTERMMSLRWRFVPAALMAFALTRAIRQEPNGHDLLSDLRLGSGLSTLDSERKESPPWNMWKYINAHTPADSRVLMAGFYNRFGASSYGGFWVDRTCFTTDAHLQSYIRLDNWPEFLKSIHAASINYVVVAADSPPKDRVGFQFPAGANEAPFAHRLVGSYGQKLAQFGPLVLYRLDVPPQ